jgi:hypothetical protein
MDISPTQRVEAGPEWNSWLEPSLVKGPGSPKGLRYESHETTTIRVAISGFDCGCQAATVESRLSRTGTMVWGRTITRHALPLV